MWSETLETPGLLQRTPPIFLGYYEGEMQAYKWEINHADETGVSEDYVDECGCGYEWARYEAGLRDSEPDCDRPPDF
jgi:hypothetical protein